MLLLSEKTAERKPLNLVLFLGSLVVSNGKIDSTILPKNHIMKQALSKLLFLVFFFLMNGPHLQAQTFETKEEKLFKEAYESMDDAGLVSKEYQQILKKLNKTLRKI